MDEELSATDRAFIARPDLLSKRLMIAALDHELFQCGRSADRPPRTRNSVYMGAAELGYSVWTGGALGDRHEYAYEFHEYAWTNAGSACVNGHGYFAAPRSDISYHRASIEYGPLVPLVRRINELR